MMTKKCIRCGEEKPLDGFPLRRVLRADGSRPHESVCKQCRSEENKAYYRAKKAKEALLKAEQGVNEPNRILSMREAAQQANQAFPLLSPAYWDVKAAMRAHGSFEFTLSHQYKSILADVPQPSNRQQGGGGIQARVARHRR